MWEAISNVLTSANSLQVLGTLILILIILAILAKLNIISIKTNHIKLGSMTDREKELTVIRHQIEWARLNCNGFAVHIPKDEKYNIDKGKWLLELIFDEVVNWIVFNHIEDNKTYISLKQQIVWNIVLSNTTKDIHHAEEFKLAVFNEVEKTIKAFIAIRKEYQ